MLVIQLFVYLQLLDFLTTILGFRLGAAEASPFIRHLIDIGPSFAVAFSKALALCLGGLCIWMKKLHLIQYINYWYAGLVVWNISIIFQILRIGN